jgi:hypothetical protein
MPPKKKIESESEETDIESYDETENSSSEQGDDDDDDEVDDDDDDDVENEKNKDDNDDDDADNYSKDKKNKTDENDDCVYRFAKPTISDDSDMDVSDGNISDDEEDNYMLSEFVLPEDRITKPFLLETEKIRLLLERRTQLTLGAKPMIKGLLNISSLQNPRDIAFLELDHVTLPLKIIRTLPSGKKELWCLNEFKNVKKKN